MPSVSSLPRRFKFLIGSIILLLILISLSSSSRDFASRHAAKHLGIDGANFHPANWLPDKLISPFSSGGNRPEEWDEFGRCLFMSPFDALSNEEKERAEAVELVEVSSGIVRAKEAVFAVQGAESNSTDEAAPAYPPRISQRPSLTNPILGLLRDGERKWQDLVSKQSKTLEHAVQEYKDRWNKNPPKGFDDW
jgi:beta-1,2-xylosyltransferase